MFSTGKRKYSLLQRRRSSSSPKMTIRRQPLWFHRLLFVFIAAAAGASAMWAYDAKLFAKNADFVNTGQQLAQYKEQVEQLTTQRDGYSVAADAAATRIAMARAAQDQLASQVKALEAENGRLKEDLAFFESLLPSATATHGIAIRRLKIDKIASNQLRYRLLIMQGNAHGQWFSGSLQLAVSGMQSGKNAMMVFPGQNAVEQQKFVLRFRYYQRVEGVLTLPGSIEAKQVQARVLEKGQIRAQLSSSI